MYIHNLSLQKNDRGNVYLPWISFLLALLLDLQSMPEKKREQKTSSGQTVRVTS